METWRQVKASHTDTDKSEVIREAERQRDREARTQDPTLPQGGGAASPRVQAWGTQTGTLPIHQGNEAVVLTLQCEVAAVQTCTQIHVHKSNCENLNLCFKLFCAIQLKYHAEIPNSAKVWYAGIPNSTKVLVCWKTQFNKSDGMLKYPVQHTSRMLIYPVQHKHQYAKLPNSTQVLVYWKTQLITTTRKWNTQVSSSTSMLKFSAFTVVLVVPMQTGQTAIRSTLIKSRTGKHVVWLVRGCVGRGLLTMLSSQESCCHDTHFSHHQH